MKLKAGLGIFFALAVLFILNAIGHSGGNLHDRYRDGSTTDNAACFASKDALAAAIHYARSGDNAAVAGIRARSASVMLAPNTRIRTTDIDGELVEVDVLSGYHVGRSCWVSYSYLRTE